MATDVERLVLQMSADIRGLEKSMARAQAASDRAADRIAQRFNRANGQVSKGFENMGATIAAALAAVGVGAVANEAKQLADSWTLSANKIAAAGVEADQVADVQKRIADLAIEARSEYAATADLFAKLTRASGELGASQAQVFRVTETVSKALAAGGASAGEANSAILQLSQGLASGVLAGDELRAIRENSPVIAQAIAREFGVTIGGLKKLGEQGELTSARVFKAILQASAEVDAQFAKTSSTIDQALTNLTTRVGQYISQVDQATGATRTIADAVNFVAENIDALGEAALITAGILGGALAGQAIAKIGTAAVAAAAGVASARGALTAMTLAAAASTAGMNALRVAMAFFGGPIGLAVTALGVAIGVLAATTNKAANEARGYKEITDLTTGAIDDYAEALSEAATQQGKLSEEQLAGLRVQKQLAEGVAIAARWRRLETIATLEQARAQLELTASRPGPPSPGIGSVPGAASVGPALRVRQLTQEIDGQTKAVREAEARVARLSDEYKRLEDAARSGAKAAGGGAPGAPSARDPSAGPRASADNAAQIAALEREAELRRARAADDTRRIAELERAAEIEQRTESYIRAGVAAAQARIKAEREVTAEQQAADAAAQRRKQKELLDLANEARATREETAKDIIRFDRSSTIALREELAELRALIDEGIFTKMGGEQEAARRYVDLLVEMAARSGDAKEALQELRRAEQVRGEEAVAAERRIKEAAREARAQRDAEMQKVVRIDEVRDDVKEAFRQAIKTGDWDEAFRSKLIAALDRSFDRVFDKIFDAIFDGVSSGLQGGFSAGSRGVSGGNGGFGSFLSNAVLSILRVIPFGGARATGGPVTRARAYLVGERGPEMFVPNANGQIMANALLARINQGAGQVALTQRQDLKVSYQINLAGANGDNTIRQIAREEAARGAAQAIRFAERNSPLRNARFEKLGS